MIPLVVRDSTCLRLRQLLEEEGHGLRVRRLEVQYGQPVEATPAKPFPPLAGVQCVASVAQRRARLWRPVARAAPLARPLDLLVLLVAAVYAATVGRAAPLAVPLLVAAALVAYLLARVGRLPARNAAAAEALA